MTTVTLIGSRLAEPGQTFVYEGPAPDCEGCPFRDQCLNLDQGHHYRVTGVRENAQTLDCAVHDHGVRAVEVEPAPFRANVSARNAYAGSRVDLPGACPHTSCPSHEFCEPEAGDLDREYRIDDILGEPPHEHCELERDLTLVTLSED